jgi:hypothetical protein
MLNTRVQVWTRTFKEHDLGMIFPKLVNMPLVMKKFVRALNMFPSSLPKYIYKNA